MKLLIIADDLTGANDTGVQFSKQGISTIVSIGRPDSFSPFDGYEVGVVDLETRNLSPSEAAGLISAVARDALNHGIRYFYKKTDSTLRGNIGAEICALMDVTGDKRLALVPAYPDNNRTVSGGNLYVANQVGWANSGVNITVVLNKQCNREIRLLPVSFGENDVNKEGILLFDGENNGDLLKIAQAFAVTRNCRLFAGPAAFAQYLPRIINFNLNSIKSAMLQTPLLIVNGSAHPVSRSQVTWAKHAGYSVVEFYSSGQNEKGKQDIIQNVIELVRNGKDAVVLSAPLSSTELPSRPARDIAWRLGDLAKSLLLSGAFRGCVVFGGETFYQTMKALSAETTIPLIELFPGIPLLQVDNVPMSFVSKAGGFGPEDLIERITKRAREER